jgi:hypothetical protein
MEEKCKIELHDICSGSTSQWNLIKTISSIALALLVTLYSLYLSPACKQDLHQYSNVIIHKLINIPQEEG